MFLTISSILPRVTPGETGRTHEPAHGPAHDPPPDARIQRPDTSPERNQGTLQEQQSIEDLRKQIDRQKRIVETLRQRAEATEDIYRENTDSETRFASTFDYDKLNLAEVHLANLKAHLKNLELEATGASPGLNNIIGTPG